jgi:hypothetical protein
MKSSWQSAVKLQRAIADELLDVRMKVHDLRKIRGSLHKHLGDQALTREEEENLLVSMSSTPVVTVLKILFGVTTSWPGLTYEYKEKEGPTGL